MAEPSTADILRELARAKAVFQLRAIEAVIRGPAKPPRPTLNGVHHD